MTIHIINPIPIVIKGIRGKDVMGKAIGLIRITISNQLSSL